jgi:ketosteroid isomerase-like protein
MLIHANAALLEKLYANHAQGDFQAVLDACSDDMTWQIAGRSPLAGKYTKANYVSGFIAKHKELSGGASASEVHDIMASDRHATVLLTDKITRAGKTTEIRMVHVWRFDHGKPVAWYLYARDLYQFDAIWG